jgi:hypothetical protein
MHFDEKGLIKPESAGMEDYNINCPPFISIVSPTT